MTRAGRHELNLGCLKARGEYNCLWGLGGGGGASKRTRPKASFGKRRWHVGRTRIQHR